MKYNNQLKPPPVVAGAGSCKETNCLFRLKLFIFCETSENQHLLESLVPSGEEHVKDYSCSTHYEPTPNTVSGSSHPGGRMDPFTLQIQRACLFALLPQHSTY